MRSELLQTPERRSTIMPELIDFFRETGGQGWFQQLESFLKRFAGTENYQIPSPTFLAEISRDESIVRELHRNAGVDNRIKLMRQHKIGYRYMQTIWQACNGGDLPTPVGRRSDLIEQARAWCRRYPAMRNDIIDLYALRANEAAQAMSGRRSIKK